MTQSLILSINVWQDHGSPTRVLGFHKNCADLVRAKYVRIDLYVWSVSMCCTGRCCDTFSWRKRRLAVCADPSVVLCQPAMCMVSNTQTSGSTKMWAFFCRGILNVKTFFILKWASRQPYTIIGTWYSDHDLSRYILRCHTGITPKHQEKTNSTWTHNLVAVYYSSIWFRLLPFTLFLACPRLAFFVVFSFSWTRHLVMDWPYHQQTVTLSPHDSGCYLSACLFSFPFYIFHLVTWYPLVGTKYLVYCCY